ncbi:hypothetical protein HID58_015795 [Brassica napus]|uniref:Trans-cinnamate 4-monooxygenase n=1 Tax=Brassica napus TaxID=3708 RepID=A0ABQ8DMX0_BRANA|nr:hypothetical protein HID58_015795 [Brassica napus]
MDLLLLEKSLIAVFAAVVLATVISKLRGKKLNLPPGPIPIPIFGNWLQVGDDLNHRNLVDYAKKFGDLFLLRMGQRNLVVVSSPNLTKEVLHTQGVEFGSRTRNVVFDIFTGKGQDMVFTVYGEHWRKMRRIMTVPFFTNKVVQRNREGWEFEAASVVEDVKKNLDSATKGIVLRKRLQLMMYNNMFRIMFDRRFESEDDPLFLRLKALNGERSRLAQSFEYNYGDFIPILRPFLRGYLKICQDVKDRRLSLFKKYFVEERKQIASSKATGSEGLKCAIDHILDAQQKGEINEDNVLYIVENINVAAIETTLWSIEWGVAELVNHLEIQTKLRNEIDTVLGPGVQVTEPELHKLPYLQAVIKETLRLRMAIPLLVPHMNLNDAKLAGYDIPAESKILVNAWWLANNPNSWKKPEEFRPERFFEEEAHVEANGNDFRYVPFGVGRRSCPGIILALPILGITIGRLVQNFELLPPPGQSKVDTSEKGGQFSLHILNHSTIEMEKSLIAVFVAVVLATVVSKLRGKKLKLPPGPIPIPIFGNWLQVGDDLNHRKLVDYAKKFGDLFLFKMGQRNIVVVSSPDLTKEVLHTQGVEFGSRHRNMVYDIFTGKGQDMVFTVYGEHWRKMRRIMTVPFFTNKVVQQNHEGWEFEAASVVEDVKKNPDAATKGIVVRKRLQLMVYNNMFGIMFGKRFESEDDPLFLRLKFLNGERGRLTQSFEYNYGDFIPILRPFLRGYLKICQDVKDRRFALFKKYFVDDRKQVPSAKPTGSTGGLKCAIDHILEAQNKGEINDDNVLYIVENINVAAIETTLTSMEWGIAELVNHPEIQSKLRNEIDTVLGPGVHVTEPALHKLPYLQAVIKETIRRRMAVPLLVPHMNLKDAKLAGYDIPAESRILINAWWLANNPDSWNSPEEFRPERFLEEEAHVEANGNDFRYVPFGVGRRSCPGIILALPILGITIGRLVQNFELLPPPGQSKIDTSEKSGQFSLQILNQSTIVMKPRAF